MATDQETFDLVMTDEGFGVHYIGSEKIFLDFLQQARGYAKSVTTHANKKADFDAPYVDLSDDNEVNALAFTENGRDCVAILTGAVKVFHAMFPTILSLSGVFSHLDSKGHISTPQWVELPLDASNLPLPIYPTDKKRRDIAALLICFVRDFLVLHEFGHIVYGHTRWSGGSSPFTGRHRIRERSIAASSGTATEAILESHAFEVEADSYAVSTMVSNIEMSLNGIGAYKGFATEIGWTIEEAIKYWLFAIYSFFRLFTPDFVDLSDQLAEDHPLPIVRLAWVAQRLPGFVDHGALSIPKEHIYGIAVEAADELENAIHLLTGQPKRPIDNLTNQDPVVDTHLAAVLAHLEKIKPELDLVSYINR